MQVNARSAPAGITVDFSQMRNVTVDLVRQTAVAQGQIRPAQQALLWLALTAQPLLLGPCDAPLAHPPRTSKAYFSATVLPSSWHNAFGAIVETLVQLCKNRCTHVMRAQVERLMMTSYKQLSLRDWVYPGAMLTLLVVQLFMFSSSLHHA